MPVDPQPVTPVADELESVRVYDRSTLERRLSEIKAERDRLQSAIAAAEARRDELEEAKAPTAAEQLGAVMLDAQATLTAEWDECRRDEAVLEEAAEAVASWIVVGAATHARALRAVAARIRVSEAGTAAHDTGEVWWQSVIDLTKIEAEQSAHTT